MKPSTFFLAVALFLSSSVLCDETSADTDSQPPAITEDEQIEMNAEVDKQVEEFKQNFAEENGGKIKIPDLSEEFKTGSSFWEVTGEFKTFDGTFEDISTVRRTEDAVLVNDGLIYDGSCGFGLTVAKIEYQKYEFRYGIIKVNGKLSASIDGVAISGHVGVDFNNKPCHIEMKDLSITELGDIDIEFTGLGPLNKMLSKLTSWLTNSFRGEVSKKVEEKLRALVLQKIRETNCEQFRPM